MLNRSFSQNLENPQNFQLFQIKKTAFVIQNEARSRELKNFLPQVSTFLDKILEEDQTEDLQTRDSKQIIPP